MPEKGTRTFFVELNETRDLTVYELTRALSRLAGQITNGRAPLEGGIIRDSRGVSVGKYGWRMKVPVPKQEAAKPVA